MVALVNCRCGHPEHTHRHPGLEPQCITCTCLSFRPLTSALMPPAAVSNASPVQTSPTPSSAPVPDPSPGTGAVNTTDVKPEHRELVTELDFHQLVQALKAGRGHESKPIAALAARIDGELQALSDKLADWTTKADARKRIAKLEKELAAARAQLKGEAKAPPPPPAKGNGVCPECGKDGLSSVGAHRYRAHGYRRAAS